jgi:hypothetical protein
MSVFMSKILKKIDYVRVMDQLHFSQIMKLIFKVESFAYDTVLIKNFSEMYLNFFDSKKIKSIANASMKKLDKYAAKFNIVIMS